MEWQLKRPMDVLLIELGGNDGLRGLPPEATRSNLVSLVTRTRARYPAATVVLTDMKMPASMGPEYAAKFDAVFPQVAAETSAVLVRGFLSGVWGVPEFNQADQIHPTPVGHAMVASNVWRVLQPALSRTQIGP